MLLETILGCVCLSSAYDACLTCVNDHSRSADVEFITLLRIFAKLTRRLRGEEVEQSLARTEFQIVGILIGRWENERVDVRKAVVMTLAQISIKIGHRYVQK